MVIVATREPQIGEEFNLYNNHGSKLKIGSYIAIVDQNEYIIGYARVIEDCSKNPKYQNIYFCGGKVDNTGRGYYRLKVSEKY